MLFALLGYAYLVAALIVIVGLLAGLGFFLFWWRGEGHPTGLFAGVWIALGTLLFAIVHSFTLATPRVSGVKLRRDEAPELFDLVAELASAERAPAIDEILIRADLYAASVRRRRFGVVGTERRSLVLGIATLLAVSDDELRAILAHEIGHFSIDGGRAQAWAYGVRESWLRLIRTLQERRSLTTGLFALVFGWYMARFARYSFALAREVEALADGTAAVLCGSAAVGDSLVRLATLNELLARRRELRYGIADRGRTGLAAQAREILAQPTSEAERRRDLVAALERDDEDDDVHPSLAERLATLGVEGRALAAPGSSAADRYLRIRTDELCARIDEAAKRDPLVRLEPSVQRLMTSMVAELGSLAPRPLDVLNLDDLRRRAELTEALHGGLAALPVYEALAARGEGLGHLGIGRIRLAGLDGGGLAEVDVAMQLDPGLRIEAAELALQFLSENGRPAEAERYAAIARQASQEYIQDFAERQSLSTTDQLAPADLDHAVIDAVAGILAPVRPVARAFLVRKVVAEQPGSRSYFLGILYRTAWFIATDRNEMRTLTDRIAQAVGEVSREIGVIVINDYRGRKLVEAVRGALIYERPPESLPREVLPRWGARAQALVLAIGVFYLLMYGYFVANIRPQFNAAAGPIVLAPIVAIVIVLFWARRGDDPVRRTAGLFGVGGLIGMILGAYVMESEWTIVFVPFLALGLMRPPAELPRFQSALLVALAAFGGLFIRIFAHNVLIRY